MVATPGSFSSPPPPGPAQLRMRGASSRSESRRRRRVPGMAGPPLSSTLATEIWLALPEIYRRAVAGLQPLTTSSVRTLPYPQTARSQPRQLARVPGVAEGGEVGAVLVGQGGEQRRVRIGGVAVLRAEAVLQVAPLGPAA